MDVKHQEEETPPSLHQIGSHQDVESHEYSVQTPGEVWRSKFVIGQFVFNILASFLGPLGTFYLLFGYLSSGPYSWSSGPLVGVVVGSLAGSPVLIFALMPVGLPEAVKNGWFPRISEKSLEGGANDERKCWWVSPFLIKILKWRWSTPRNIALSLLVGMLLVPVTLLLARYVFGPTLSTWTFIYFCAVYEVVLCVPVLLLGLLGYALEPNLEITLNRMSDNSNCTRRFLNRVCVSLWITLYPY